MRKIATNALITDKITTGATDAVLPLGNIKTFHGFGNTSAGVGASTIDIEVSNDGTNFVVVDTLSLTLGTAVVSDSYANSDAWKYVRGNVKTISGTDAKVSLIMGLQI